MVKPFNKLSTEVVLTTPIFNVRRDVATNPETGHTGNYYVLENPDWVVVIALSLDGELILIRQWRHGTGQEEVEFPAGLIDPGEEASAAAARELLEETGYLASSVRLLGEVKPNLAYQRNTCFTYLAEGCRRVSSPVFERGEFAELLLVQPEDLEALVATGQIRSAISLSGIFWWLSQRGALAWREGLDASAEQVEVL